MICFIEKKADLILFVATYRILKKLELKKSDPKRIDEGSYLTVNWLEKADLSKLGKEKLYLRGHGSSNLKTVGGKSPEELAEMLRSQGLKSGSTIKVVGCYSGKTPRGGKPFVQLLGEALRDGSPQILCTITGITDINVVNKGGQSRAILNIPNSHTDYKLIKGKYVELEKADNYLKTINLDSIDFKKEMEEVTKTTQEAFKEIYSWLANIAKTKVISRFKWSSITTTQKSEDIKTTQKSEDEDAAEKQIHDEEAELGTLSQDNQALFSKMSSSQSWQEVNKSQTSFPYLQSGFNYAFSGETILLNGMKVIFDQPVSVYPVNLESKEEARRNGT